MREEKTPCKNYREFMCPTHARARDFKLSSCNLDFIRPPRARGIRGGSATLPRNWPRPSEGQFFGQVGGAHFALRCDATKWGAFRPAFCWQEGLSDAFIAPFCCSTKCMSHAWEEYNLL